MKILVGILFFIPFFQGILYFISKKNKKFSRFAKFKEEENYEYKNKLASTCYLCLGLIIGFFGNILNLCYDFFVQSPIRIIIVIAIILISEIFMDAFINIRIQIDDWDEQHKN